MERNKRTIPAADSLKALLLKLIGRLVGVSFGITGFLLLGDVGFTGVGLIGIAVGFGMNYYGNSIDKKLSDFRIEDLKMANVEFIQQAQKKYESIFIDNNMEMSKKLTSNNYEVVKNKSDLIILKKIDLILNEINLVSGKYYTSIYNGESGEIVDFDVFTSKISNIYYFGISGEVRHEMSVSGGGSNLGGAVLGGVIAGSAGAMIASREAIKSETKKIDERFVEIKYYINNELFTKTYKYEIFELLERLIPEKESKRVFSSMTKQSSLETNTSTNIDVEDKLIKIQKLLDKGLISKEEYDTKRNEIIKSL